jgi:hypothetical protein
MSTTASPDRQLEHLRQMLALHERAYASARTRDESEGARLMVREYQYRVDRAMAKEERA